MRYARDVLASTVQFKMHQMGMLCALRYRNLEPARYQDKTFMLYSSHALALREVERQRPRTLLDVGCGPGFIAARCEAMGVRVTGIDAYPPLPGKPPAGAAGDPLWELWRHRRKLNEDELARLAAGWDGRRIELPLLPIERGPELLAALAGRIGAALGRADGGAAAGGAP